MNWEKWFDERKGYGFFITRPPDAQFYPIGLEQLYQAFKGRLIDELAVNLDERRPADLFDTAQQGESEDESR